MSAVCILMTKLTANKKQQIVDMHLSGHGVAHIQKITGVHSQTATDFLKKVGVYRGKIINSDMGMNSRKYRFNENYFCKIDCEQKAYWLGFLMADGHSTGVYAMSLCLASTDEKHIEKFKNAIEADYKIARRLHRYSANAPAYWHSTLSWFSKTMVQHLHAHGMTPRKSQSMRWPESVPAEHVRHFIRGYFDGDGCWTWRKPKGFKPTLEFSFIGSEKFIERLVVHLSCSIGLPVVKILKNRSMSIVKWGGNQSAKRFFNYIYSNATVWLERKREKAESTTVDCITYKLSDFNGRNGIKHSATTIAKMRAAHLKRQKSHC